MVDVRTPRIHAPRLTAYDPEVSGSEPTVYNERGVEDRQRFGRVSPTPRSLEHIIQQAKDVQEQLLSSVRVTAAEPVTAAASTPVRSRSARILSKAMQSSTETSRVRRAADELLESVRRRALEAEIERLRGELAAAEASKEKFQAGEAAEAEAARLLREARVEVNRLKAALHRQGHFERLKEAETQRKAFEEELRALREEALRKREEMQQLHQVQQEQLILERNAERRQRETLFIQLREREEADRLRHGADQLLSELREEIRELQSLLHVEQSARQAAEERQSAAEGLHQQSQEENEQLRQSVSALAQAKQEKTTLAELLETERSLRRTTEEQSRDLQAELKFTRNELHRLQEEKKTENQRLKTAEESQNKLRLDKVGLEAQVKELELKVEAKGSSADRLNLQLEHLKASEENWSHERSSLRAQLDSAGVQANLELDTLHKKLEKESQERQNLQRQLDQAKQEQASLRRQLEEAKAALSDVDTVRHRLIKERDDAVRQSQEVGAKVNSLLKQQSEEKSEVRRLSVQLDQVQSGSKNDLEEMQRRIESLQKERDMYQQDVEHLRQSLRERKNAESSLREALKEEQNSSRILQQELDEVKRMRSFSAGSQEELLRVQERREASRPRQVSFVEAVDLVSENYASVYDTNSGEEVVDMTGA